MWARPARCGPPAPRSSSWPRSRRWSWGLTFGGGAAPLAIGDPGPLVRWGLPDRHARGQPLRGRAWSGALVTALFTLKAGEREFDAALDPASISAAVFTVAAAATGFLTFVNTFNPAVSARTRVRRAARPVPRRDRERPHVAASRRSRVPRSRCWPSRCARGRPTLFVAILAIAALVPMGTQGHSGEEANHNAAVMALVLHIIAAAVWLGGLLLMVVVRPLMSRDALATALSRYSSIALVGVHRRRHLGHRARHDRRRRVENLASPYGAILLVKVGALIALGVLGAWYRRRLIGTDCGEDAASRRFWALVALELALHGRWPAGAAAALARTRSADDLEPPGGAHARGVPHRRAASARADARPLVHGVEPRPAVGVRRRLRRSSSTSRASGGCAGAATLAAVPHRAVGRRAWLCCSGSRAAPSTPTRTTCSACTWSGTCC